MAHSPAAVRTSSAARRPPVAAAPPRARGFTLLEVMVALAIVSIALVSLLALGNRSIATHARLQKLTEATMLAQHKMAQTEADNRFGRLEKRPQEGVFADPDGGYRWRLEFADTPLSAVKMVTVTVLWGEENRNESVALTSLIF